jgi:hypothetical protein
LLAGDVTGESLAEAGGTVPVARPDFDAERFAPFQTDPAPWRERVLAAAPYLEPE